VLSIRVQIIEYLQMGGKIGVVPLRPREIGEFIITTMRLKLGGVVGAMAPNPTNGI